MRFFLVLVVLGGIACSLHGVHSYHFFKDGGHFSIFKELEEKIEGFEFFFGPVLGLFKGIRLKMNNQWTKTIGFENRKSGKFILWKNENIKKITTFSNLCIRSIIIETDAGRIFKIGNPVGVSSTIFPPRKGLVFNGISGYFDIICIKRMMFHWTYMPETIPTPPKTTPATPAKTTPAAPAKTTPALHLIKPLQLQLLKPLQLHLLKPLQLHLIKPLQLQLLKPLQLHLLKPLQLHLIKPLQLQLQKTPQLHLLKTPQLHLLKTPQLHLLKTPQLNLLKTPQLHLLKTTQLHLLKTPQLHLLKTPQLHLQNTPAKSTENTPTAPAENTTNASLKM
ncbi:uncharacterized protein LOC141554575 [Sminthopsis crassicaudata]|uniref:uncharacterized protein LOC141554575 n=1 Tax=Sminthopsis crassicaudata TaxID=9301 RepID=UPI003D689972